MVAVAGISEHLKPTVGSLPNQVANLMGRAVALRLIADQETGSAASSEGDVPCLKRHDLVSMNRGDGAGGASDEYDAEQTANGGPHLVRNGGGPVKASDHQPESA
jgi:hypothetical protein